jgi:hypothetical protein
MGCKLRALPVLVFWWLASPAQAADIYAYNYLGTTVIRIDGLIQPGDEQKFAKLNYAPPVTVRPSGPGGDVVTAIDIGKMIWKRGYTALVYRIDGGCASACTIIWLSGRKSAIQINSILEFHTAYDRQTGQAREEANQYIMDHFRSVGLTNRQAWALTHAAPPQRVRDATLWWARELGFEWQDYFSYFGTASCSARWCVGRP